MGNSWSTRILTLVIFSILSISYSLASDFSLGSIEYTITSQENKTVEVSKGIDNIVAIPEVVIHEGEEYKVVSIGYKAFYEARIDEMNLPNSITRIDDFAFAWSKVRFINLPQNLEYLGEKAFYECWELYSITIPNSLRKIGDSAFEGCWEMRELSLGNSVEIIGKHAFFSNFELEKLKLPSSVRTIKAGAFGGCRKLKDLEIPYNVETIELGAFQGCHSLSRILLPSSIRNIGAYAFHDCEDIVDVYLFHPYLSHIQMDATAFDDRAYNRAKLYVRKGVNTYGSKFQNIEHMIIKDVSFVEDDISIIEGEKMTLKVEMRPNYPLPIKFETDAPEIVSIKADGSIIGLQEGCAHITGCVEDIYFYCDVTVNRDMTVRSITLNNSRLEISEGETERLVATVDSKYPQSVSWETENENVAQVLQDGTVLGIKEGQTKIIAKAGELSSSCDVIVKTSAGIIPILLNTEFGNENGNLKIYDLQGRLLNCSFNELPNGWYLVKIGKDIYKIKI